MKIKRRNFFLELIIGIIAIYLIVLIFLFFFQRNLMYHPDENNYSHLDDTLNFFDKKKEKYKSKHKLKI